VVVTELLMRDVTRAGRELGRRHLVHVPASLSVGALLEFRIRAEVAAYNEEPGPVFAGLVQPADSIRHSDGYRMRVPRRLDADGAVAAAREAVAVGMLSLQVGDERLTDVDDAVAVDEHDEVLVVLERPVVTAEA
jgi:hypothetical protein